MHNLKSKTVVDERFEIIDRLGAGGMGVVYKAQQVGLDRVVALKVLLPHLLEDENALARFELEAQALASMKHRNISLFYAYGIWHGRAPYIAMEFLDQSDLSGLLIDSGNRLTWRRTLNICKQIAEGMAHAHNAGVIHRDLKPSNVFVMKVEGEDVVKVADFGLAKLVDEEGGDRQKLTQTGHAVGSPHYMSPEQISGLRTRESCDIYALGCIMYQCLFGRPPYSATNMQQLLAAHLEKKSPVPKPEEARDVPPGILNILRIALSKEPCDRFASMEQFVQAIDQALASTLQLPDGKSRFVPPSVNDVPAERHVTRKRLFAWSGVGVAGVILLMVAFHSQLFRVAADLLQRQPSSSSLDAAFRAARFFDFSDATDSASTFYDAAISIAKQQGDLVREVRIALDEAAMYKRVGNDTSLQRTLKLVADNVTPALESKSYSDLGRDDRRKFSASCAVALSDWHPSQAVEATAIGSVQSFMQGQAEHDQETLWRSLWLRFNKHLESQPLAFKRLCLYAAYDVLEEGHTSPYRQYKVEWIQKAFDHPIAKTPAEANVLAKDVSTQSLIDLALNYCLHDHSDASAKTFRDALYAFQRVVDNRDDNAVCYMSYKMLYDWVVARPIPEQIEFFQKALANEDTRSYWDASDIDFRRKFESALAHVLIESGNREDAIGLYQRGIHTVTHQLVDRRSDLTGYYIEDTQLKIAQLQMIGNEKAAAYATFKRVFDHSQRGGAVRFARYGMLNSAGEHDFDRLSPISRSEVLVTQGRIQEAIDILEPIANASSREPVKLRAWAMLAKLYAALGKSEEGLKYFSLAESHLGKAGNNQTILYAANIHLTYGDALAIFDRPNEAKIQYANALHDVAGLGEPSIRQAWSVLVLKHIANLEYAIGNLKEADKTYSAAENSSEYTAEYWNIVAAHSLADGDFDAARKALWHGDTYQLGLCDEIECAHLYWLARVEAAAGRRSVALDLARQSQHGWKICMGMDLANAVSPIYADTVKLVKELSH